MLPGIGFSIGLIFQGRIDVSGGILKCRPDHGRAALHPIPIIPRGIRVCVVVVAGSGACVRVARAM